MIRRAKKSDLEGVNSLLRQVLMVHAVPRPDIFIPHTKKYSDEQLLKLFEDDTHPIFVSVNEKEEVLGYAFCIFEEVKGEQCLQDMKSLYIDDICVDEKARKQHVASGLYEYVKNFAKEQGCYRITLNVWDCNPTARAFYDAMGMVPLKTTMETIL